MDRYRSFWIKEWIIKTGSRKRIRVGNKKNVMATKKKAAKKSRKLTRSVLVAEVTNASQAAAIDVKFFSGIGQITIVLFRNGVLINMQSISTEGVIQLSDVQGGDTMSVNGVCTAQAKIAISLPTHPETPQSFSKGVIMTGYLFL
jgi:hypothetical protein